MKDTHMLDTNNALTLPDKQKQPAISAILFDLDDTLWPIGQVIARAEQLLVDWLTGNASVVARHFSIESLH
jgi:FMN hydrolase / 5-amino-6-(5-phospho-D-ribitylamino)uracil phosphatase